MIFILASPRDAHSRMVVAALQRMGEQATVIDAGTFGNGAVLSYRIGGNPVATTVTGEEVRFDAATCVWYRRPRLGHVAESIRNPDVRAFCRQEWANLLEGLFLNSSARFVNHVQAEFAAVKPRQLHVAREIGWAIPDTLFTSDPDQAGAFIDRHHGQVIHKALTAPKDRMIDTRAWDEADRPALATLSLAPTIFQEMIHGPADVRVTVVGKEVFAAKISTLEGRAGIDSRMDMDAPYEVHDLPAAMHDRIVAFMDAMGLVYGTIDLKLTDDGEYVFFEVNPQGQFLYVEILTGLPITQAMANLLAGNSQPNR
jgi:hypothetical protein